jgi:hypothetical protein
VRKKKGAEDKLLLNKSILCGNIGDLDKSLGNTLTDKGYLLIYVWYGRLAQG